MDVRIKELVEKTKQKFGLNNYYLQRYSMDRQLNLFGETNYLLSMEWFPDHEADRTEEELNPNGTAVIEIDVNNEQLEHIIFVDDVSYAKGITFNAGTVVEIIQWVEQETNLLHETDFRLEEADDRAFYFVASHQGIPVYPRASIEVKIDHAGNLTHFSKIGYFPDKNLFETEEYALSMEHIENVVREQITLVEWPDYENEQMTYMYGMEELFIKNDQTTTFAYDAVEPPMTYVTVDKKIETTPAIDQEFEEKEIELIEDIPVEEAFSNKPNPDAQPISEEEVEVCTKRIQTFLRQVYPEDPTDWKLTILYRERGYIHAILKNSETNNRPFQRKIVVFIDYETLEVLNYMDNDLMVKAMDAFKEPERVNSTEDCAYNKLKNHLELTPHYVFDHDHKVYVLCTKIDSHYAVDAHTDALVDINDL